MNTQDLTNSLHLNALVTHKQGTQYTLNLESLPCQKDQKNCCGGYCGSMLWKKVFTRSQGDFNEITINSMQNFPVGSHLLLSLSPHNMLYLQAFLWLVPTLILLFSLSWLPSQWWGLVISLLTTASIWLLLNHFTKKHHFGLRISQL